MNVYLKGWERMKQIALCVALVAVVASGYGWMYGDRVVPVVEVDPWATPEPIAVFANEQIQSDPDATPEQKRLFAESLKP